MSSHSHHHHPEDHFAASAMVRDIVIGMADGLTVPFALAAGLSGAMVESGIIITAGLAEIAAGAIAMGLGGYLAGRTDVEHFKRERRREELETIEMPEKEAEEVAAIFRSYGLDEADVKTVVKSIASDHGRWVDFMMKFELGLDEPDPRRARNSAVTISLSYIIGGLIPLSPYFWIHKAETALAFSIAVTLVALFVFGYIKGLFIIARPWRSAFQTLFVGGTAGAAAFFIAKWIA